MIKYKLLVSGLRVLDHIFFIRQIHILYNAFVPYFQYSGSRK